MKTQHRKQAAEKRKREEAFRAPYGKYWNEFERKWKPDPEHRIWIGTGERDVSLFPNDNLRRRSDFPGDSCGKCDRIAELERENARKDALLRECRGHLRGHKMSMLAYTTERLIAAIDAALKEQNKC